MTLLYYYKLKKFNRISNMYSNMYGRVNNYLWDCNIWPYLVDVKKKNY